MTAKDKDIFQPVNDPIASHSQVSSCIEIMDFDDMVRDGEIAKIQVFFERIGQEVYNARKKNYTWGFKVIEPEFYNFSEHMVLVSKLYKEENLADLNSVVFKLFTEFNNIILSTALHMHIPIRGIIRIGNTYRGSLKSKKPALVSGKDPLILSDLLKVFSFGEIFPAGFSEGFIPAFDMPFHFGESLTRSFKEVYEIDSVGIFMPMEHNKEKTADVTILSNMIVEADIHGQKWLACNWMEWMSGHSDCSTENIIAFAKAEARKKSSPHAKKWQSLIDYSSHL
jgi:hypothetical protein